jgi:hypothetical protein
MLLIALRRKMKYKTFFAYIEANLTLPWKLLVH